MTNHNKSGFTIIETLVAVTVLMISIAGPLVVASKGLFGANLARSQMIASYLAQESMEAIKNIRDNNLDDIYGGANKDWLLGVRHNCSTSTPCDMSALDGYKVCQADLCPINMTANGYSNQAGSATKFRRGYYIHNSSNEDSNGGCNNSPECAVTVKVTWYEGGTQYDVTLNSILTDTLR